MLPPGSTGIYVSGELASADVTLPPPRGVTYHLLVSPFNEGGLEFTREFSAWFAKREGESKTLRSSSVRRPRPPPPEASQTDHSEHDVSAEHDVPALRVTQRAEDVEQCEAVLCYLNSKTWSR